MSTLKTLGGPQIDLHLLCNDCRVRHHVRCVPERFAAEVIEWDVKHKGHRTDLTTPQRLIPRDLEDAAFEQAGQGPWWLDFRENANIKLAYAASAAWTITLASLATSSTFVAGEESTTLDNTSNLYLDYLVGGKITTGTTPTASHSIRIYAHGSYNDTPSYVDVFTGSNAAITITTTDILAALPLLADTGTNGTSNVAMAFPPKAISACFDGLVPKFFGLYVTHDTGVNLNATGGNHVLSYTGIYQTAV